jgi:hypothetical protein
MARLKKHSDLLELAKYSNVLLRELISFIRTHGLTWRIFTILDIRGRKAEGFK